MSAEVPTRRLSAWELLDLVLDPGSFSAWDEDIVSRDPLGFTDSVPYQQRLARAQERAGTSEAVVTGRGTVRGLDVVAVVGEFGFLAGTMGAATAERVARAFEHAATLGLPVLGMPASGGTRMQEGTVGFVQMARTAAAVQRFAETGLTYIAYLRDPTTGGVLASWASLAHVTFAQPGALIGLTGPRVVELLTGEPFPAGIQVAEHLRDGGIVDDIVAPEAVADRVARVLQATQGAVAGVDYGATPLDLHPDEDVDGWVAIQRSRRTDRPGIRELLDVCATDVTLLRGDGAGHEDPGMLAALARVAGIGAVLVALDRRPGERGAPVSAPGLRKARRAMGIAGQLGLPLVTVVDTVGARTTAEDEEGGIAAEVARCLATMSALPVPTMSLLLGEGSGGGAMALLPADRVVAAEHAWLSPIAPEGASAILYRTTEHAAALARAQGVSSTDLRRLGIVDVVIPDRPALSEEGEHFGLRVAATAARELRLLLDQPPGVRLRARQRRYRTIGGEY